MSSINLTETTLTYETRECKASSTSCSCSSGQLRNRLIVSGLVKIAADVLTAEQFYEAREELKNSSFSIFRKWVPVTLRDEGNTLYLNLNVASIAKRLNISRNIVYAAAKRACSEPRIFHNFLQSKSGANFLQTGTSALFRSAMPHDSCKKICNFIRNEREALLRGIDKHASVSYYRIDNALLRCSSRQNPSLEGIEGDLPYLQMNRDSSIYVHFTGQPTHNGMHLAIDYDRGAVLMVRSVDKWKTTSSANKLSLDGAKNIATTIRVTALREEKVLFIYPYYDRNLQYELEHRQLSTKKRLQIISDIIEGAACLADRQIVHRNLHPANIYLCNKNSRLQAFIGGLECATPSKNSDEGKYSLWGIQELFPPECIAVQLGPERIDKKLYENSIRHANSTKRDAWTLGCIIRQLMGIALPKITAVQSVASPIIQLPARNQMPGEADLLMPIINNSSPRFTIEIENHSLEYLHMADPLTKLIHDLVCDLQQIDPEARLSANTALARHKDAIKVILEQPDAQPQPILGQPEEQPSSRSFLRVGSFVEFVSPSSFSNLNPYEDDPTSLDLPTLSEAAGSR
ncbi:MAG: protein kinase [Chlamydiales bacterium]|nr:protein kinase [Chlamydiales bacterium]